MRKTGIAVSQPKEVQLNPGIDPKTGEASDYTLVDELIEEILESYPEETSEDPDSFDGLG